MKMARWVAAVAVIFGTTACAAVRGVGAPDPQQRFERAVAALTAQDFATALPELDALYRAYWDKPVGQRALVVLAAANLDPRNPSRSLWGGADYAARLIGIDESAPWLRPLSESLYLVAVELGAHEERLARAEQQRQAAEARAREGEGRLPEYSGESVPAQLSTLRRERDGLRQQVAELEQAVAERDQEIERIRRALRP